MLRKLAYGASTAALMLTAATAVYAQETTGGIRGQVTDASGAPVAGAAVTVVHVPSGTTATTVTNAAGVYDARSLRVGGPYEVSVSAAEGSAVSGVGSIGIGSPASLDIQLVSAATVVDEIVVTGIAQGRLQTSPRSTFNETAIDTLPTINRDIRDFVRTSPFATTDPTNNDALSIGGQSNRTNAFLVDGIRQGDDFGLNSNGYPTQRSPISISALEAVSVEVAPYDVQYGTFTGGVVNSVTKSGGNRFSGEVFYEQTDADMQGDTFTYEDFQTGQTRNVDLSGSEFEETTWGATLSGPIIRDRLFFLVNYESYESTQPVLTGADGSGAAVEVPGITQADVDLVRQFSESVYGFDPLDWAADELLIEDEKWFAKIDWNINDRHRAAFSYQQTEGGDLRLNGSSTSSTFPSLGLLSQAYVLESNLTTYKAQLFSDWTDRFSTELSISRKEVENISSPLAGDEFAAFQVYLDDPGGPAPRRSIRFGPERSRHANQLTNDVDQFRFVGTYRADGGHRFSFGYEREALEVFNLFVQFANGEYEFASLTDFENGRASSIGYQSAATNNKFDAGAEFGYALNTLFAQDEWDITPNLTLNFGLRYDWYESDDRPLENPAFEATYGFSNTANLDGITVIQPRFGFNWQATDTLTIYGGVGRFQGGSPNVWVSNNYTNTGNLVGIFQCKRAGYTSQFTGSFPTCTAEELAALDNVDGFDVAPIAEQRVTESANRGTGTINVIDPTFETPSIWKTSIGAVKDFDFSRWGLGADWRVTAEYIHSEVDHGVGWVDLNYERQRSGAAPDGRPTFFGSVTPAPGQTAAAAAAQTVLMLTNFEGGETDQFAVSISKDWYEGWANGLGFNLSYTYLDSTEQNPGTSSVALSNFQQVAVIDPNSPEIADSNYEVEDAIKLNISYNRAFFGDYMTRINLFGQRRSGLNFSYAFANGANNMFGESVSQQRALFYVPQVDGSGQVTATSDPIVRFAPGFNLTAFNEYLQRTGLIEYAGQISPRNAFKSPDWTQFDLYIEQELPAFFPGGARLALYGHVENIGNLLNDEWGVIQQLGFPFYSTDVDARNCQVSGCAAGIGNFYEYRGLSQDSASGFNSQSVWQAKFGVRYRF
ncbi:TonB-dependent receptor [Brevundimonas balnearis]|uniref:TonB-dependent receptor domain-containing protein n=1 Tax=Brevundimonas balnearis TaxID=1572858 RepID=A0ABV6R581_9CAUL